MIAMVDEVLIVFSEGNEIAIGSVIATYFALSLVVAPNPVRKLRHLLGHGYILCQWKTLAEDEHNTLFIPPIHRLNRSPKAWAVTALLFERPIDTRLS